MNTLNLFDQINEAIKVAMKAKEENSLRALRGIKSALLLAKTEKGATDEISEEKGIQILQKLVKQRKESYTIFKEQNRNDLAEIEAQEIAVIEKYLPKQMDENDLRIALQQIITNVGATSAKDMGKVMGMASKELGGLAEGKLISLLVKELLGT